MCCRKTRRLRVQAYKSPFHHFHGSSVCTLSGLIHSDRTMDVKSAILVHYSHVFAAEPPREQISQTLSRYRRWLKRTKDISPALALLLSASLAATSVISCSHHRFELPSKRQYLYFTSSIQLLLSLEAAFETAEIH